MVEAQLLLSDLVIGESPRWHENRLWFANWQHAPARGAGWP